MSKGRTCCVFGCTATGNGQRPEEPIFKEKFFHFSIKEGLWCRTHLRKNVEHVSNVDGRALLKLRHKRMSQRALKLKGNFKADELKNQFKWFEYYCNSVCHVPSGRMTGKKLPYGTYWDFYVALHV